MKKIICLLLVCILAFATVACNDQSTTKPTEAPTTKPTESSTTKPTEPEDIIDPPISDVTVMSWEEYIAAEIGSKVVIEAYVQGQPL